ncbi:MAG TPA: DUF4194 domain-containing protein [Ideonella sp.]|uniref:DUF4194 domain-containing protein n=1 Tax=Ideonella sp. TaxID=1929293 RepID=UPI002C23D8EA|nr:DUF4194 domain-containing protein [Ideonella sp.]HSI49165.1 DUF4194 domain-containing protein [Ideonella sp.]
MGDKDSFTGDTGELKMDTRRVLVQLLLGPSVDARRQSKLWPVLVQDEKALRSRLHELFLDLVIDHEQKVAFTRQVVSDQLDVPILLRKAPLTFIESALLLFLRQKLTQADAQGERAVVSVQEMQEHLSVFEKADNSDRARFERQTVNAVEKAKTLSLLRKLGRNEERYEVAPTLKLLFSAEEIQGLMRTYESLAEAQPSEGGEDSGLPDEPPVNDDGAAGGDLETV